MVGGIPLYVLQDPRRRIALSGQLSLVEGGGGLDGLREGEGAGAGSRGWQR